MYQDKVLSFLSQPVLGLLVAAAFLAVMTLFFAYHDSYRDVGVDLIRGGDLEESPFEGTAKGRWRGIGEMVQWDARGGYQSSGGVRLGAGGRDTTVYRLASPVSSTRSPGLRHQLCAGRSRRSGAFTAKRSVSPAARSS